MAFLGIKTKKGEVKPKAEKKAHAPAAANGAAENTSPSTIDHAAAVILRPRVTEKATLQNTMNVYVFEVHRDATKKKVAEAVHALYKVMPRKVRVVPIRRKATFVRGKKGHSAGGRKAYVYFKKDDKIEIV